MQNKKKRIVITGMGVMTGAGENVSEFFDSLNDGISGITKCDIFNTEKLHSPYFGILKSRLPYRVEKYSDKTRVEFIINHLIKETMKDSGLTKKFIEEMMERCQLSLATSVGLNEYVIEYMNDKILNKVNPHWLNDIPEYIVKPFWNLCGIRGGYYINASACTAGTAAIGTAITQIRKNIADIVIVCGVDPLTEFSSYGFHSLQNTSHDICKPFDIDRDGLSLGEGGAMFVFEEYEHAINRNAKIYCEVYGYGIGNDAYHATSPDPTGEGACRTMEMAINDANIKACMIDYVNAHGTGTEHNDSMECVAFNKMFGNSGNKKVYVNSTKSFVGHCLAAAGTVELAATVLSVLNNRVFPNITLEDPVNSEGNIVYLGKKGISTKINYAISNSYAFAGNSASAVIGKLREQLVK